MGRPGSALSGNELAWPAREHARPAPRGHVPGVTGMNGGRSLMEALLSRARVYVLKALDKAAQKGVIKKIPGTEKKPVCINA